MKDAIHQVTVNFADGVSRSFAVPAEASILDAAIEAEIPLLYQCRSGGCSSCMAQLADGDARTRPGASSSLLASEYAAGQRLLCLCQAQSDCTFSVPYGSEVGSSAAKEVHAFIDSIERIAVNVVRLTLELADGDWLEFRPGSSCRSRCPASACCAATRRPAPWPTCPGCSCWCACCRAGRCPATWRRRPRSRTC